MKDDRDPRVLDENTASMLREILEKESQELSADASANVGKLFGLYFGYKQAYNQLNSEIGDLRVRAAPVVRDLTEAIDAKEKPSIFFVSLPKSGTVFVSHTLAKSLGYDHTSTLVTPTFPKNVIWKEMVVDFLRGRMISASHMQPDESNLNGLLHGYGKGNGVKKIVVHMRDPRAALLSWTHFHKKLALDGDARISVGRREMATSSLEDQIGYDLEHSYPDFVNWLKGWTDVAERDDRFQILLVEHEELSRSPLEYFDKILDFYGIKTDIVGIEKTENTHFRKGDNKEWREFFTPAQRESAWSAMASFAPRFGWTP